MVDKHGGPALINIGDKNIVVGAQWNSEKKKKAFLLSLNLRVKANKEGRHFGAVYNVNADKKSKESHLQFALFQESEISEDALLGDVFIAKNASTWVKEKKDAPTIFIKSIENKESVTGEPNFWLTIIESDGSIANDHEGLLKDRFDLQNIIDTFLFTNSDIDVVIVDNDGASKSFAEDHLTIPEITLHWIPEVDFEKAIESSDAKVKRIYRPSKIKVKKVASVAAFAVLGISSWAAYSYYLQSEARDYFSNQAAINSTESSIDTLRDELKEFKSGSTWNDRSFREVTLEQFSKYNNGFYYSPVEVSVLLKEINKVLPRMASEWRLTKMSYENNRFFARYERIQVGSGVYFMLDEKIQAVSENSDFMTVRPYSLADKGETRIYSIIPYVESLERKTDADLITETLTQEMKQHARLGKATKRLLDKQSELMDVFDQFSRLDFQSIWLKMEMNNLHEKAIQIESEISSTKSTLTKVRRAYKKTPYTSVPNEVLLGNVLDFVTIMQLDSFFEWQYPELLRTFPDEETLKDRTPKKKRKKKSKTTSKKTKSYGPAIETYGVIVSTRESEEEGKITSYGFSDIIRLGLLLDKPFINVHSVEYNSIDEQWAYRIHFNRSTQFYKSIIENTGK